PEVIGGLDQTEVVLADNSQDQAPTAARLVGGLSPPTPRPVTPKLAHASSRGQRKAGVTTPVLGGTPESPAGLQLAVPARTTPPLLRGASARPLVAAESVPGSSPVLAIQGSPGAPPALLDGAVRELVDSTRFFGWSGNVVLGAPGDMVALDLTNGTLQAR